MNRKRSLVPNLKKRGYLLPPGCKNLSDIYAEKLAKNLVIVGVRVNGKIREREVNLIGSQGEPLGIVPLAVALQLAKAEEVDLVEIDRQAKPTLCRLADFGKFRYDSARRRQSKTT